MGHTYTKKLQAVVYLIFKFNWVAFTLLGNPASWL